MTTTENREEYLEAVFKLAATNGGATVTRIARELGVRPASVSEMLSRMVESGTLVRDKAGRGAVVLTEAGRREAARLVRRHRLSERFLVDCLQLPWDQVHAEACKFEHVLSDEVEARLAACLGRPQTCPHGRAIPYDEETFPGEATLPLSDCEAGRTYRISHIADESPEFLRYVGSLGLTPGTAVHLQHVEPFEGPLLIQIGTTSRALGRTAAREVFVEEHRP
jgi:DtxR family Mn-dependent transcriptional regulator